ncbi:GlsB/YeaQ/YmgE family stress response membrane protein [Methylocystis sp. B8]|uniref:GlsB/YeaQ/YmgE family stress response membrane protein n=1 Tax=Methylocystis sp. B8 TaxID=544938 RepID=UPI0010FD6CD4|nr:GlsB/YeaQ/YmgE family stress response membrane protein [Methylocystis sp. B8]TLG71835.1 GlsB/YeaQ/YmgE family stress response membrane protein [Methylocystis sp. B8]
MYVPYQTLAVMLLVGLVAGWIAAKIVTKHGMGLAGVVVVGVIGVFIGDWLLPRLGIPLGTGLALAIFNATVGAIVSLVLVRVIRAV